MPGQILGANGLPATTTGREIVARRHREWSDHVVRWRWLLDSYEGGDRYRQAVYGTDSRGMPIRNLIRHKREYPSPTERVLTTSSYLGGLASDLAGIVGLVGSAGGGYGPTGQDQAAYATDDDYELRRARTPVPTFVSEAVGIHLGKIYAKEVDRDIPESLAALAAWVDDVDGQGTPLDEWMSITIAPLLLTLGLIDVLFDHPPAPLGSVVASRADELSHGLDRCVASYVLPENVTWWKLDGSRRYVEAVIMEHADPDNSTDGVNYRHWTPSSWTLYDARGAMLATADHPFGRPPMVRLIDRRKFRCRNIGKPRYEGIAERQREYYNRDSELILSDVLQAFPLLQGPEDFAKSDGKMQVGPNWLLPMKKNGSGGDASYQGYSTVNFPKDGAESIRKNKSDLRDDVDRDASLVKPAGSPGTNGQTVSQSGISKQLDNQDGHARLTDIAKTLARCERQMMGLACVVLGDKASAEAQAKGVKVSYPMVFDLASAGELVGVWAEWQALLDAADGCVETQLVALTESVRKILPGRSDEFYEAAAAEVRTAIEENGRRSAQALEMRAAAPAPDPGDGGPGEPPEVDPEAGGPPAPANGRLIPAAAGR